MKLRHGLLFLAAAILIVASMMPTSGPALGKQAPDFDAVDQSGAKFKLSDYRGKVVVLDFWGSWCTPCVGLLPHNNFLLDKYPDKDFTIIGVDSDDPTKATANLKIEGVTYRNAMDGGQKGPLAKLYGVDGWPTVYVIDRQGVIRYKTVGVDPDELDVKIAEALRKP